MVGDVNIYMNDPEDSLFAEIEIMIAEPKMYVFFSYYSCIYNNVKLFFFVEIVLILLLLVPYEKSNDNYT